MKQILHKSWWGILLLSLLITATGLYLIVKPDTSMISLLQALGVFLMVTGVIMSIALFKRRMYAGVGIWFGEGIFNVLAGLFILLFPDLVITLVFIIFGIWIVFISLLFIMIYFNLNRNLFFLISGLVLLAGGFALIFNPLESAGMTMRLIGIVLSISGIFTFITALNLRKFISSATVSEQTDDTNLNNS